VGVAHQLGGALGLALLVVVFATAQSAPGTPANVELAHRIAMAISAGAVLLAIALLLVLFVVGRSANAKPAVDRLRNLPRKLSR
jgi:uncharacterized membrane protein YdbT with pleckstrin-like domain